MDETGNPTRDLFERMRAGDRAAFDRFFERSAPRILIYLQYNMGPRLRGKMDPSDLLQNLYLGLLEKFPSFSRRAGERGIHRTLLRMADHEITEAYRRFFKVGKRDARREVATSYLRDADGEEASLLDGIPSRDTSITRRVVRQEEYRRILRMLSRLTPLEQFITVSRVIEEVSVQEIADLLGKSRGAVHMILSRARDKLREAAGRGEDASED
jgi:RNA polymerase sigma-70 factor, ECF subfamily